MISLEQFIEETNAAATPEAVFTLFQKALNTLGYDRVCYSLITDHPSLGLEAGHGVMRNYSEDWMKHYVQSDYQKIDPVPQYCFVTNRPFTWDWVVETQDINADQTRVMNEAHEAGLFDGVAVPLYGLNGELAGIGMASSTGDTGVDKNMLCKIRAFSFQFHLAYTEKEVQQRALQTAQACLDTEDKNTTFIQLSDREREILLWAAEGKSDPVIADILQISYPTVRYHMNNIFKKLGTNERTFAVVKAIRNGLILPSYVSGLSTPIRLVR